MVSHQIQRELKHWSRMVGLCGAFITRWHLALGTPDVWYILFLAWFLARERYDSFRSLNEFIHSSRRY